MNWVFETADKTYNGLAAISKVWKNQRKRQKEVKVFGAEMITDVSERKAVFVYHSQWLDHGAKDRLTRIKETCIMDIGPDNKVHHFRE